MPYTVEVSAQTGLLILTVGALVLAGVNLWQDRVLNEQEIADINALTAVINKAVVVDSSPPTTTTLIGTTQTITYPTAALWVHPAVANRLQNTLRE